MDADRKTLIRDNNELKWSKEYLEQELDEKNERIYELEESEFMLGFLDDLLRMKTMKRLWRWGRRKGKS